MAVPEEGSIWVYNGANPYRIYDVKEAYCTIQHLEKIDGEWHPKKSKTPTYDYPLRNFSNDSGWKFSEAPLPLSICAECNQEKQLPKDDFLCAECRSHMPVTCRLVADLQDEPAIVLMSGTDDTLEFKQDSTILLIKREDLPEVAIKTFKKFLESA